MKRVFLSAVFGAGLLLSASAFAADTPPAGAIAKCKDGTYFSGTSHKGACKGHQGVQDWLDKDKAATASGTSADSGKSSKSSKSSKTSSTSAASGTSGDSAAASDKKSKKSKATDTAAASATAPAGATAKCKDGTFYTGTSHSGACRGHKGVAEWLDKGTSAASTPAAAAPSTAPAPAPAAAPAAKPSTAPAPSASSAAGTETKHTAPTPASQIPQKAGGGPGQVWVNAESKVYHCQGDEWYGKTKEGSYMTEAAAKAAGNRAARGKECGQ